MRLLLRSVKNKMMLGKPKQCSTIDFQKHDVWMQKHKHRVTREYQNEGEPLGHI